MGAAGLTAALVLSGCSGNPRAAATVEGRTVTTATLDATVADLEAFIPSVDPRTVLVALMVAPHFIDAAAEHGVGVSDQDALDLIEMNLEASGTTRDEPVGDGTVEVIRFTMAANNLGTLPDSNDVLGALDQEIRELDIDVNPRYGTFDPAAGSIVADELPWIVTPQ